MPWRGALRGHEQTRRCLLEHRRRGPGSSDGYGIGNPVPVVRTSDLRVVEPMGLPAAAASIEPVTRWHHFETMRDTAQVTGPNGGLAQATYAGNGQRYRCPAREAVIVLDAGR